MYSDVVGAYVAAWGYRDASTTSLEILRTEIEKVEGGIPDDVWEIYSDLWNRGIAPSAIGRELRRSRRRALRGLVGEMVRFWRFADREPWWMRGPTGLDLLAARPEGWSLPFTDVAIECREAEYAWLVRACEETTSDDGESVFAFDIWLDPGGSCEDGVAVMLGRERVGSIELPLERWRTLGALRESGIVAGGSLDVDPGTDPFTIARGVQLPDIDRPDGE